MAKRYTQADLARLMGLEAAFRRALEDAAAKGSEPGDLALSSDAICQLRAISPFVTQRKPAVKATIPVSLAS